MRYRTVFLDEWVRVRNLMHGRIRADRPCSICRTAKCATVWYSIKTKEVRCLKCFDAEGEHWERELRRPFIRPRCVGGAQGQVREAMTRRIARAANFRPRRKETAT